MSGKVLKWPTQKTALDEASDFEKEVGFDGVIIIGLVKGTRKLYFGTTDGLDDANIVFILERATTRVCLEAEYDDDDEYDEEDE